MTSEGTHPVRLPMRIARAAGQFVLDTLFPPSCQLCGAETDRAGLLCIDCFKRLTPINAPFCRKCGNPQPSAAYLNESGCCAQCERSPPVWNEARGAFLYDKAAKDLILQLKYADRQEHARFLGDKMCRVGLGVLDQACIVVPVPVHRKRLLKRRYNQAALLAWVVSKQVEAQCLPDALVRVTPTNSLAGFSRQERYRELAEAIVVKPRYKDELAGKNIVLVDDVLTSGATASACTKALKAAGVTSVSVLVAALVPRQSDGDLDFPVSGG